MSTTTAPEKRPTDKPPEWNRTGVDLTSPLPRPKVSGIAIDAHCHLLAAKHADLWFRTGSHYGFDAYFSMGQLEEAVAIQRNHPGKVHFITVPSWRDPVLNFDDWLRRLEAFYNIGSRIVKFHMAPGTMASRQIRFDHPGVQRIIKEAVARNMVLMSHLGDPETWYQGKYKSDPAKFGLRDEHYRMWEAVMTEHRDRPWLGAHMGGNPEDLPRLQSLLDRFPNLFLDCSATRWMVREISSQRDSARAFFIRNQDRILFGSDQVSGDDRGFDFLASRWWCHRKLWETDYVGPSPIYDPDLPDDRQPVLRGLALPDAVIQKMYHDNPIKLLATVGVDFPASV
jgi:hypothetical protein